MRIIAGIAKGTPLTAPRTGLRPTSDRVRQAIFSSLGERVAGAEFLDLFAGSGAIGLEAASRGTRSVVFVEQDREALVCLERNLHAFRKNREMACDLSVIRGDVFAELERLTGKFTLVFADPPYGTEAQRLLEEPRLAQVLSDDGLLVLESARRIPLTPPVSWRTVREAEYGDTRVSYFAWSAGGSHSGT